MHKRKESQSFPSSKKTKGAVVALPRLAVSRVRFSQKHVSAKFSDGRTLAAAVQSLTDGSIYVDMIPAIRVVEYRSAFYTLDNRRLRVFKDAFIKMIPVIHCDLNDPEVKREFFAKLSNKTIEGGGEVQSSLTTMNFAFNNLSLSDNRGIFSFEKCVLNWNLERIKEPLAELHRVDSLPSTFDSIDQYFERFKPLILEESRAILDAGIQQEKGKPATKLTLTKAKFSNKYENPSSIDFKLKLPQRDFYVKAGDVLLLSCPSDKVFEQMIALVVYTPEDNSIKIPVKIIIDQDIRLIHGAVFEIGKEWQAYLIGSLITQARMYDVCYQKPHSELIGQLREGRLTAQPVSNPAFMQANQCIQHLNSKQSLAVKQFLQLESGIQFIQGPPGTGKTTTVITLIQQLTLQNKAVTVITSIQQLTLQKKNKAVRVLVCAPSNKAVQVLALRIYQQMPHIPMVLVGVEDKLPPDDSTLRQMFLHTWHDDVDNKISELEELIWGIELTRSVTIQTKGSEYFADPIQRTKPQNLSTIQDKLKHFETALARLIAHIGIYPFDFLAQCRTYHQEAQKIVKTIERLLPSGSLQLNVKLPQEFYQLTMLLHNIRCLIPFNNRDQREQMLLNKAQIIFATLSVAGRRAVQAMENVDVLIIDEANQALEPETLIPFRLNPKKVLMIGDTKQLPATVLSRAATDKKFNRSLMHRMVEECKQPAIMLRMQYRMHPKIRSWPSRQFYDDQLFDSKRTHENLILQQPCKLLTHPCLFVNITSPEKEKNASYYNLHEASCILSLLAYLKNKVKIDITKQVGVISFYNAQVSYIKNIIMQNQLGNVTVSSVDGFQGDERDIIIISFVRSNLFGRVGFLKDFRRLNVALTRARHHLIMLGDANTLAHKDKNLNELIFDIKSRKIFIQEGDLSNYCEQYKTLVCQFFRPSYPNSCRSGAYCENLHDSVQTTGIRYFGKRHG